MKRFKLRLVALFLPAILAFDLAQASQETPGAYSGLPQVEGFLAEMAERGLDTDWVRQTLEEAQRLESVRNAVMPRPAGQRKDWQAYRQRFINPSRTDAGRRFLQEHAETLTRASNQFGVPVEVIVGIIGVETFYGRNTGRYRVVDALSTLAFDYPVEGRDRSAYFRDQLAEFFMWCARERCQPLEIKGSYAGAIGIPQFMPGNIYRYGTDFDGDGHIDLNNPEDAIGSVARFLAKHGWIRELSPTFPVDVSSAQLEPLLAPDILPTFTPERLEALGAEPLAPLPQREAYALVELQNGDGASEYVLGSRNFFALTRYNRSSYYATAVLQLGMEVVGQAAAARPEDSPIAAGGCAQC